MQRPSRLWIIFWAASVTLALGVLFAVRGIIGCWQITALPGIPPGYCNGQPKITPAPPLAQQGDSQRSLPPAPPEIAESPPPQWDGGSRINILFLGLDLSDLRANDGPPRTDTMILATIDPITKSAGMLSITRDLYVNIPGFGYSRINTAYPSGEASRMPGGGPGLVMKTVTQFTGVPVQYYIFLDFDTFVSMINILGGVDVYVNQKLNLDLQGTGLDHHVITCCGMRHLDGQVALAYARTRDASQGATLDDVGRAQRQQQIIMAIRDKVFSPGYFPTFIAQAPALYKEFGAGIHTNLTFQDAIQLAYLVKDIQPDHIQSGVIDYHMSQPARVILGGLPADVMIPYPDKIRLLVDQIFTSSGLVSPIARGDPISLMEQDAARLRIWNGTTSPSLDVRTANYLLTKQMHVTDIGKAPQLYKQTTIFVYSPKIYALRYLVTLFGVKSGNQIYIKPDSSQPVDIEVRLGSDWVGQLPP